MEADQAKLIRKLRWVKSVRGNVITTKPGVLKLPLTHFLKVGQSGGLEVSTAMKKPRVIGLPSYKLGIYSHWFKIAWAKTPTLVGEQVRLYPTMVGLINKAVATQSATKLRDLCGGVYLDEYRKAKGEYMKAMVVAEYLQVATPDMGGTKKRSMFAYSTGLIGEEIIKVTKQQIQLCD